MSTLVGMALVAAAALSERSQAVSASDTASQAAILESAEPTTSPLISAIIIEAPRPKYSRRHLIHTVYGMESMLGRDWRLRVTGGREPSTLTKAELDKIIDDSEEAYFAACDAEDARE